MDILATLAERGFTNVELLDAGKGLTKIRTTKGWVYERFKTADQLEAWMGRFKPEGAQ